MFSHTFNKALLQSSKSLQFLCGIEKKTNEFVQRNLQITTYSIQVSDRTETELKVNENSKTR